MAEAPTAEEAFGASAPGLAPTADEAFADVQEGSWLHRLAVGPAEAEQRIYQAFKGGAARAFGDEPLASGEMFGLNEQTYEKLRKSGLWNDYAKGQNDVRKDIYERTFRAAVGTLGTTIRAGEAAIAAPIGALGQFFQELGILKKEDVEAAAADPGIMMATMGASAEFAMVQARRAANLKTAIPKARANGVVGEGEAGYFEAKPITPEHAEARVEAAREAGIEPPIPEPAAPDVHTLARRVDPLTFEQYDALELRANQHRLAIQDHAAALESTPEAIAAQEELNQALGLRTIKEAKATEIAPLSEDESGNIFLRPQPEDVEQATLPSPYVGEAKSIPLLSGEARASFDEAALNAQDVALTQELRTLPRGGRAAVDKLAKLDAVEQELKDETISIQKRRVLLRRKDEILADTTPEKLRAEAAPIERRRTLQAQRKVIADRLGEIASERATAKAAGVTAPQDFSYLADELGRLTETVAAKRIAVAQEKLDAIIGKETPELAASRTALRAAQLEQMNLLPDVASAYRQAHEMMPPVEAKVAEVIAAVSEKPLETTAKTVTPEVAEQVAMGERVEPPQQPRTATRTTTELRATPGTGDLRTRTLSEGIEAKAIENSLTEGFGDLPEYHQLNMAEQAQMAADYIAKSPDDAMAVAMGRKAPPRGVLPESILVAVEKKLIADGDVEGLRQLATESKLSTAATTMGQRIRTLGERNPTSPVGAIHAVQEARRLDIERRQASAFKDTVKEIKATVRKSAPTRDVWASFISEITCADG